MGSEGSPADQECYLALFSIGLYYLFFTWMLEDSTGKSDHVDRRVLNEPGFRGASNSFRAL